MMKPIAAVLLILVWLVYGLFRFYFADYFADYLAEYMQAGDIQYIFVTALLLLGLILGFFLTPPKRPFVKPSLVVLTLVCVAMVTFTRLGVIVHHPYAMYDGFCTVFFSSPVIDGRGNIYVTVSDGFLLALRPNGSEIWKTKIGKKYSEDPSFMIGAIPTPALHGNSMYLTNGLGEALALDLDTGAEQWRTQYCWQNGIDNWAVGVYDDLVLVMGYHWGMPKGGGSGDHLYALNRLDGLVRWSFEMILPGYHMMPAVMDGLVVVSCKRGGVYCLDLQTGMLRWFRWEQPTDSYTLGGSVIGPNKVVYVVANIGTMPSANGTLRAHDLFSGKLLWTRTLPMVANAHPVVFHAGGTLRIAMGIGPAIWTFPNKEIKWNGQLVSVDATTGDLLWTFDAPTHYGIHQAGWLQERPCPSSSWNTAVVNSDGTVYAGWHGGILYAVNGTTGKEVSHHDFHSTFEGSPAIGPGMLVVPSCGKLATFFT